MSVRWLSGLVMASLMTVHVWAKDRPEVDFGPLNQRLQKDVIPVLKSRCLQCHSSKQAEGELDLERFAAIEDVRKSPRVWLKVVEMLDTGEMPPKEAPALSSAQNQILRAWIDDYLKAEARASAGDPGPVVLRRLNNAEYTFSVRDLTGAELHPAREFPVDGAGGEGFTNAGNALAMSPALVTKYFDAGKEISRHAVLLPDGFRFSNSPTPGDWTNEILADIRALYRRYSDSQGATRVNLQGIVFDTNDGGRLPVEKYLALTIKERETLTAAPDRAAALAREHGLSPKYLATLWKLLHEAAPNPVLDPVIAKWKAAKPEDAAALGADIAAWQSALTRFQNVGHMKPWMVPNQPILAEQELRIKLAPAAGSRELTLYLASGSAGDGKNDDILVWQRPRIVTPGQPDLLLKDVREFTRTMETRREQILAATKQSLLAAAEVAALKDPPKLAELSEKDGVDRVALGAWFDLLGIGAEASLKLDLFTKKVNNLSGYAFISGWEKTEALSIIANSSDNAVRVPGNMKPHAVAVHPSPTQISAVGWLSPITGTLKVQAKVTHAHPECGNGVTWSLELRRGATRRKLSEGLAQGGKPADVGPVENLTVEQGDLVSLLIGPRDGNHSCDLTDLEFVLATKDQEWSLTKDVSSDIQKSNPQPDQHGNEQVWHFYSEPVKNNGAGTVLPAGSLLARWQAAAEAREKAELAGKLQELLLGQPPADAQHPDAQLHRQLTSLGGPLFAGVRAQPIPPGSVPVRKGADEPGLDPDQFGVHPFATPFDAASLCCTAPHVYAVRLPADLVQGAEFVVTARLHPESGPQGSAQAWVTTEAPGDASALRPQTPVLAKADSAARQRFIKAFDEFRQVFPAALCYPKIVPVDEVITLTLFHREDEPLVRLMLSDAEQRELDRLWRELRFVSRDAFTSVDAFQQLLEYASQDGDPKLFEPLRKPILDRAEKFRQELLSAEPQHLEAVLRFAAGAYRRPLQAAEADELTSLYQELRAEELNHDDAIRFLLARVLISPRFLYRGETPGAGAEPTRVTDWELASRLSYFLWSSAPDEALRQDAAAGRLSDPDQLTAITRRMMNSPKCRRMAEEFGCQWLQIYDFLQLDEKSEKYFPEFADLRADMHEEAVRFLTEVFTPDHQHSMLTLLEGDFSWANARLAKFYGIEGAGGQDWQRLEQWRARGRGGVLGLSATLAKQSGASRTSPILRGNWVSEVLLGEKLPKPPKGVPPLPEEEATESLTVRELTERHSLDEKCSNCHRRIDPLGFALEGFDAIGRRREKDLGDRPIDTATTLLDGTRITGLDGLRNYLAETRREAFVRQFCRKLLGYALGRGLQLSDEPLLDEMLLDLKQHDYEFFLAVKHIVHSPQFQKIRGQDFQASAEE